MTSQRCRLQSKPMLATMILHLSRWLVPRAPLSEWSSSLVMKLKQKSRIRERKESFYLSVRTLRTVSIGLRRPRMRPLIQSLSSYSTMASMSFWDAVVAQNTPSRIRSLTQRPTGILARRIWVMISKPWQQKLLRKKQVVPPVIQWMWLHLESVQLKLS